jgi:hypothetical protein
MKKLIIATLILSMLAIPTTAGLPVKVVDYPIYINYQKFMSNTPILNYEGRTYVPLRGVLEQAGLTVNWEDNMVSILTPTQTKEPDAVIEQIETVQDYGQLTISGAYSNYNPYATMQNPNWQTYIISGAIDSSQTTTTRIIKVRATYFDSQKKIIMVKTSDVITVAPKTMTGFEIIYKSPMVESIATSELAIEELTK